MSSPISLFTHAILLLLLLNIPSSQSLPSVFEYRMLNDPLSFEAQTKQWIVDSSMTTSIVTCNSKQIFKINRPPTLLPSKPISIELDNIPGQSQVFLAFTLYEFSSTYASSSSSTLEVITDTYVNTDQYMLTTTSNFPKSKACGSALGYMFETRIYGILPPTVVGVLTLQIIHDFASSDVTAFGIRDVVISLGTEMPWIFLHIDQASPAMQKYNHLCATALQYNAGLSGCFNCDISCGACFQGGFKGCYECAQGYGYTGIQCALCDPSCATCSGQLPNQCTSCPSGKTLASDNTCITTPTQGSGTNSPGTGQGEETLVRGGFFDTLLTAPSEPGTVTFVTFVKFMQYVRQLKVRLPPRLEKMSVSQGRPVLSLHVERYISNWFTPRLLPVVLEKQIVHERFIANFGGDIFVILIIVVSGLLFSLAKLVARGCKLSPLEAIFDKLTTITRWNLALMLCGLYIDDIILYSVIEFKTIHFDLTSQKLSFAMCIVIDVMALAFLVSTVLLARKSAILKKEADLAKNYTKYDRFLRSWRSFQLYFRGFNEKPFLNQFFLVLYISRSALPIILATALESAPVIQAVFQMLISLVIVLYAIIFKPLRKKINQYQLVIIETTILALNICVLALVAMNNLGINDTPGCVFLGDAIIIGNVLLNLTILIILAIKLVITLKEIGVLYKTNRKQAAISCIHLLVPPLQQCGFGFEELLGDILVPVEEKQTVKAPVIISKASKASVKPIQDDFNPKIVQKTAVDEVAEQPTTERLGYSSSRLLIGSQAFNQSQMFNQSQGMQDFNDMSMNESVEIRPPKHRKESKPEPYIVDMKSQSQVVVIGSENTLKQEYDTYKKSQMIVRTRSNYSSIDDHRRIAENLVIPQTEGYKQNL